MIKLQIEGRDSSQDGALIEEMFAILLAAVNGDSCQNTNEREANSMYLDCMRERL